MNLVKTYIDKDTFGGIGLFAKEFIPAGKLMWELQEPFDRVVSTSDIKLLYRDNCADSLKEYIERYAYEMNGKYCICGDDARFSNHSFKPNTISQWDKQWAKVDIQPGDQIFTNYLDINDNLSPAEIDEINSYK